MLALAIAFVATPAAASPLQFTVVGIDCAACAAPIRKVAEGFDETAIRSGQGPGTRSS